MYIDITAIRFVRFTAIASRRRDTKAQWVKYDEHSNVADNQTHYLGTGTRTYGRDTMSHTSDGTKRHHTVCSWLEKENRGDA